jgi:hypothetical protein
MSTKRNYSGQDQRGRVRGPWNSAENYRLNAVKARFTYQDSSEEPVDNYPFVQANDYELHIFAHDAPIWWEGQFSASGAEGGASSIVGLSTDINCNHAGLGATSIGTYNVASADCYDSVSLVTLTNSVTIAKGFHGRFTVPDGGIQGASLAISGTCKYLGLGSGCQGPMRIGTGLDSGTRSYLSVILLESEYTQAMQDAGDIFTSGNFIVQVCGIFAQVGGIIE